MNAPIAWVKPHLVTPGTLNRVILLHDGPAMCREQTESASYWKNGVSADAAQRNTNQLAGRTANRARLPLSRAVDFEGQSGPWPGESRRQIVGLR